MAAQCQQQCPEPNLDPLPMSTMSAEEHRVFTRRLMAGAYWILSCQAPAQHSCLGYRMTSSICSLMSSETGRWFSLSGIDVCSCCDTSCGVTRKGRSLDDSAAQWEGVAFLGPIIVQQAADSDLVSESPSTLLKAEDHGVTGVTRDHGHGWSDCCRGTRLCDCAGNCIALETTQVPLV
ncbi:hypothetical protein SKAU_G00311780 [Synaphobranchus kaupii]|uniref:Uncharacterized protein n=1 Tax=Synaphobranchus kaupii TaxID=118154 RepID=A0A9Q1ERS6_SYNKA|nr:hypothetical protein SKAU_G00311780 [Synaphobranchus kaupii]